MREIEKLLCELNLDIARSISETSAMKKKILPWKIKDNKVVVLALKYDELLEKELEFIFSMQVILKICDEDVLNHIIEVSFNTDIENLEQDILINAIKLNVSDIHMEPNEKDVLIRYRVDGRLTIDRKISLSEYLKVISKIKVNSKMDITEKRKPQDGKCSVVINGTKYDLRISTIPLIYGEKIVIRILYGLVFDYSISNLNLTNDQLEKLKKIIAMKNGLVIVNGPTGSGKSTTLYTILQEINNSEINITTLEDPTEVLIPGVNQMNLNRKADIGFSEGLRGILRQDPDVIMIGEIRDEETAVMAIRAALTGHKVYSTIHTKAPKDVFLRLEDMGIKSYLIKDSLVGIISQRLIRVLCDNCKVKVGDGDKYKAEGCLLCGNSGYKGRKAVTSVNFLNSNLMNLQDIYMMDNSEMKVNLLELLKKGEITVDDYMEFIISEGIEEEDNEFIKLKEG